MFTKIVVPVDLEHVEQARQALLTAQHNLTADGHLVLVHVVAPIPAYVAGQVDNSIFDAARQEINRILLDLKKSANLPENTEVKVETGKAYRKIIDQISDPATQAIVMPAHSPRVSDIVLGSVAAQVVRHAPCSVFVLRFT